VQGIDDLLSRLVAAATLLRAGRLPPLGITLAIDTASHGDGEWQGLWPVERAP